MEDYLHSYIEEITNDIIKPIEYDLTHSGLNEEQQKKVIKEVLVWLLMFCWAKGKNDNEND